MKETEFTNIQVSREIYVWLESQKIHRRQSFNEVLEQIKAGCEE